MKLCRSCRMLQAKRSNIQLRRLLNYNWRMHNLLRESKQRVRAGSRLQWFCSKCGCFDSAGLSGSELRAGTDCTYICSALQCGGRFGSGASGSGCFVYSGQYLTYSTYRTATPNRMKQN